MLEKTILCSSLLEMCVQKFEVDLFSCFRTGARQVFTISLSNSRLTYFQIKLSSVRFLLKFYIFVVKQIYT